jgi:hypothetical protein
MADMQAWYARTREATVDGMRVNTEQFEMLRIVIDRVAREMTELATTGAVKSQPLLWLLHGRPGTGKSHVLRLLRELFDRVLQYQIGVEYQVAAFQAVMAAQLGGDTLHHACGIAIKDTGEGRRQRQTDTAKRVLRWRWLIIDEISMVSARLLAEVDLRLRSVVCTVDAYKRDGSGSDRAFGGLNVLFAGDFWQLDPPEGGALGRIPTDFIRAARQYAPAPTVAHGQSILWGKTAGCVAGITELTQPMRCKDAWYNEVLEECRMGELSDNNYNFLHGLPTTVPGSYRAGRPQCGNAPCERTMQLMSRMPLTREAIGALNLGECQTCRHERQSRRRVARGPEDPRFREKKFVDALLIVANNDVKYDINKRRALHFAAMNGERITWAQAKDTPTLEALREKPSLGQEKRRWLNRHDRDTGELYGMLPLVCNMPVALTDHVDRSTGKNLLRGKIGRIQSWVLEDTESSTFEGPPGRPSAQRIACATPESRTRDPGRGREPRTPRA